MKISINKPCHENWDNMLPDEKGAFCLACQKSVVDFSSKTIGQIKDFFNQKTNSEKVCGRFEDSQLQALSFDHFFADFVNWKFIRKVALIIFFVFGLSLFSNAQTKPKPKPKPDVVINDAPPMVMGAVAYVPEDTTKIITPKDSITPKHIKGKVKYTPEQSKKKPGASTKTMGEPEVNFENNK
jgi:hypothetical protein